MFGFWSIRENCHLWFGVTCTYYCIFTPTTPAAKWSQQKEAASRPKVAPAPVQSMGSVGLGLSRRTAVCYAEASALHDLSEVSAGQAFLVGGKVVINTTLLISSHNASDLFGAKV